MRSHPIGTGQATKSDEFSEGGGHFQSKNLYMQILDLYKGLFRTFSEKKLQYSFSKMSVEGRRLFGIFPKIHPNLVAGTFHYPLLYLSQAYSNRDLPLWSMMWMSNGSAMRVVDGGSSQEIETCVAVLLTTRQNLFAEAIHTTP